jgi:AbiV family abortive infection protein
VTLFKPEVLQAIEACRNHARDLYEAAKQLRDRGLPNVAYHLATLSLEELGKGQLIGMQSFAKDESPSWYEKQLQDHVKKLFWALWSDVFGKRPNQKELEELRGTANIIHNNRLRGLYVEGPGEEFVTPKEAVTDEMLAPLMTLVEARLGMFPALLGVEYDKADLELLSWFLMVSDDPDKRRFVFSSESFKRMEELGPKAWLYWIKQEMDKMAADAAELLRKEMSRGIETGEDSRKDKWELKIRLYSQSHSIRGKDLKVWNERTTWLKLYPVDKKKDQLDAILRIPRFITIQMVYLFGFGYSNLLLAALNIASSGFFWWHKPMNLSTFYESLLDLENNMKSVIRRAPELKVGWPHAVLDTQILEKVVVAYVMMPKPEDTVRNECFSHYMSGIALWAKTDVFLQFELQAYGAFLTAAKAILRVYHAELGDEFPLQVCDVLASIEDDVFRKKHEDLMAAFDTGSVKPNSVTLSEVAEMKRLCDALFMRAFIVMIKRTEEHDREAGAETGSASESAQPEAGE